MGRSITLSPLASTSPHSRPRDPYLYRPNLSLLLPVIYVTWNRFAVTDTEQRQTHIVSRSQPSREPTSMLPKTPALKMAFLSGGKSGAVYMVFESHAPLMERNE